MRPGAASGADAFASGQAAFAVPPLSVTTPPLGSPPTAPATVADSLLPSFDLGTPFGDSTGTADSSGTAFRTWTVKGEAVGVAVEP